MSFHHRKVQKRFVALDVRAPEVIRSGSGEVPLDEIRTKIRPNSRGRREYLSAAVMHFPIPVDAVVLGMDPADLPDKHLVSDRSGRSGASLRDTVAARGDEPTFCRTEDAADGLDLRSDRDACR